MLKSGGAKIRRNTPWSPNLRAHVERVIQTLKQEVLDHFVVVAERHLNYLIREAQAWYNKERPHSGVVPVRPKSVVPCERRSVRRPVRGTTFALVPNAQIGSEQLLD